MTENEVAALVRGLARAQVPYMNERLAEATAPLTRRIEQLEECVSALLAWRRQHE